MKCVKEETIVQDQSGACHMIRIHKDGETLKYGTGAYSDIGGYPMEKKDIKPWDISIQRKKIDAEIERQTGKKVEDDDFGNIRLFT